MAKIIYFFIYVYICRNINFSKLTLVLSAACMPASLTACHKIYWYLLLMIKMIAVKILIYHLNVIRIAPWCIFVQVITYSSSSNYLKKAESLTENAFIGKISIKSIYSCHVKPAICKYWRIVINTPAAKVNACHGVLCVILNFVML